MMPSYGETDFDILHDLINGEALITVDAKSV